MITGDVERTNGIEKLHPGFKMVLDYMRSHDVAKAENGTVKLDGDNVFVRIMEIDGKTKEQAVIEMHREYIDIQFPIVGVETYGRTDRKRLQKVTQPYDAEGDCALYGDTPESYVTLHPGEFVVFYPEDGHAPCIGQGKIKKVIAKIRVQK